MTRTDDKRKHPRVQERIAVRARHGGDVDLETINLSAGGLFCTSPAWVAPMTRLALALQLPSLRGDRYETVEGEAVVVRTEPEQPVEAHRGGYRIALFFARMDAEHRRTLQRFLHDRNQ
jgi:hypothetical protein